MAQTYSPATGISGSIIVGGVTYCADNWNWDASINVMETPSFCGGAYQEIAVGKKTVRLTFSGTWDLLKNPFSLGLKLGAGVTAIFYINNAIYATTQVAVVENWNVGDEADGLVRYTCTLRGDWVFNDFSASAA